MKKMRLAIFAIVVGLFVSGCSFVSTPATGLLYTDTKAPLLATGEKADPNSLKTGEATCEVILGVSLGDCSIQTAAKNGNITTIHSVDTETFNVLGLYATYKVIVKGQ